MGLVTTWLNGIGLSSAVPTFQAAGIVTPAALAELDVTHFEALGISDPDDRRKLFYLVQRIKMAVNKDKKDNTTGHSVEEQVEAVFSGTSEICEEKKEDATMNPKEKKKKKSSSSSSPEKKKKSSPDKKKTKSASLKSPLRRSRRLASQAEAEATDNNNDDTTTETTTTTTTLLESNPLNLPLKTPALSPTRGSQSLATLQTDAVLSVQIPELASREVPSYVESTVKRQEYEDNEAKNLNLSTSTARKTASRPSAAKQLSSRSHEQEEPNGTIEASLPTPAKATTSIRSSGLKMPTPVITPAEPKNQKVSKLQNPGKSIRTGKALSAIPSEEVAPMSPISYQQVETDLEENVTGVMPLPNRRQSSASSQGSKGSSVLDSAEEGSDDPGSMPSVSAPSTAGRIRPHSTGLGTKTGSQRLSAGPSELSSASAGWNRRRSVDPVPKSSSKATPFVQGGTQTESWSTQVARHRDDNNAEYELFRSEEQELYEFDMRIRVIVRKRPVSNAEASLSGGIDVIHPLDYGDYGKILVYQPKTRVDLTKEIETIPFAYDNVYGDKSTNLEIYQRSLRNLIQPFFRGQQATVFAYGQTGSGKTYTMMGSNMTGINAGTAKLDEKNLGLYYLAALDIFEMVKKSEYNHLTVQVSLFEIYGGKLFDLLNQRRQIKCLEDSRGKVCFPGLTEHPVGGPDDLMSLIEEGARNRSTGTTSRNADSSRSHAVLQLRLRKDIGRSKNIEHGRLNFIDLAGSERGADTSSSSLATRLEGAEINTSLLALKEVIRALATGGSMTHIPFRGSKLTQVLKDSFVGQNSRCCMIACVSPDIANCEQTLNTLRYADRVKERHSESGALALGYEQPTRLQRLELVLVGEDEAEYDNGDEDVHDDCSHGSEDREALALDQHNANPSTLEGLIVPSPKDKAKNQRVHLEKNAASLKDQAGEALIAAHRSVMSTMLSMVKDEMILVNRVDADRDGLNEYIHQLESIQRAQLDLISNLRDSLSVYVTACENPSKPMLAVVASDEDSFEDLRD